MSECVCSANWRSYLTIGVIVNVNCWLSLCAGHEELPGVYPGSWDSFQPPADNELDKQLRK